MNPNLVPLGKKKVVEEEVWGCSARGAWVGSYPCAPTPLGAQAPRYLPLQAPTPLGTDPPRYPPPLCLSLGT